MSIDPTTPQPRVIVLCFDGTSNQFDETNTNVVKFHRLLEKSCPLEQIVYYQPGVGTYFSPGVVSPLLTWLAKILDLAFAWYLDDHVKAGYKFLMQNFRAGDKICLFGFSRGAHTARALAGLLHKIGLLPRDNDEQISFAYTLYKGTGNDRLAVGFKETFCAPVQVDFIGVWDTVASVGLVYGRDLPFTSANSAVRVFRHALSLDERRARFQPRLFRRETPEETAKRESNQGFASRVNAVVKPRNSEPSETTTDSRGRLGFRLDIDVRRLSSHKQLWIPSASGIIPNNSTVPSLERRGPATISSTLSAESEPLPSVREVWFAGCHSDVGGGAVEDTVRYSLGDISLRWMVKQVILSGCGIKLNRKALRKADVDVSTFDLAGPEQLWREDSEDETITISSASLSPPGEGYRREDMLRKRSGKDAQVQIWSREQDGLADNHDELKFNLSWYWLIYKLLELLPVTYTWQAADGTDKSKQGINRGKGRIIRSDPPKFHKSVWDRMQIADLEYTPKAIWAPETERYVD